MIRNLSINKSHEKKEDDMKENKTNELLKIKSHTRPQKSNESVEVDLMSIVNEFCARFEKKGKSFVVRAESDRMSIINTSKKLYHSNTGSTTRNRKIQKKGKDSGKNFKSRNTQLLKELKRDLSADQFKAFKSSAKSFQSDKMSASDFVSLCLEEINIHRSILVKALRVLPNVEKREKALKILGL